MELIVRHAGEVHSLGIERRGHVWEVSLGERLLRVDSTAATGAVRSLLFEGRQYEVAVRSMGDGRYVVSSGGGLEEVEVLDPLTHLARESRGEAGAAGPERVSAAMPGRVVSVLVETGQEVESGQGVVVLEAMKMENEIRSERAGTVRAVFVEPGQAVEGGDPLFEIG